MVIRADGENMHDVLDPDFLTCLDKVVTYGFPRPARDGSDNMNFIGLSCHGCGQDLMW